MLALWAILPHFISLCKSWIQAHDHHALPNRTCIYIAQWCDTSNFDVYDHDHTARVGVLVCVANSHSDRTRDLCK
ncbi:hypothetical protein BD310DRAFT_354976 [Dichomitus squalens]|uniref:Secreted protein n=1 Tax=Dichomitus squalens TaxID=114155 RepID=A0A4Q9PYX1_9APHY|nr:hypothetical protein BD310DRAFT_354976 [Dichomitus squalens]